MTEYWQSQARKFCDFCKCWIADQKVSIEFHESGKRHQQAVKDRLRDIGQKGARDEKKAAKEDVWLKQMEQQAMKDYRAKDLQENSDLTAKIFNEKRCERDQKRASAEDLEESKRMSNSSKALTLDKTEDEVPGTESVTTTVIAPAPPAWGAPSKSSWIDTHNETKKNPFEQRVSAKTHGTKYHNPPPATKWREATTDDGNIYYWHTESYASVWEPPVEGYLSIKGQEKFAERQQKLDEKKKSGGSTKSDTSASVVMEFGKQIAQGPVTKPDPYGSWHAVDKHEIASNNLKNSKCPTKPVDYQTPEVNQAPTTSVILHNDRTKKFEVGSRKTPSLGRNEDEIDFQVDYGAGIRTTASSKCASGNDTTEDSNTIVQASKPAIVFRKRKVNPDHRKVARRREDGDD